MTERQRENQGAGNQGTMSRKYVPDGEAGSSPGLRLGESAAGRRRDRRRPAGSERGQHRQTGRDCAAHDWVGCWSPS